MICYLPILGFLYFWGLKIDISVALLLVVAVGLAVDYSSHITHHFMMTNLPTRNERMKHTMIEMGPAVFNGGCSTFVAFVLLANSKSAIAIVFFRVFFLVVSFGLYNGLVLMPVILSLIGPKPFTLKNKPLGNKLFN